MTELAEQRQQILRDIEELESQVAAGEIDRETADRLRATYQRELDQLSDEPVAAPATTRSRTRLLVGSGILLVGFAVTIAVLGATVDPETNGALQGVAAGSDFDPSDYSDETLEAVIAANADDPAVAGQLPYMRFALAERYFNRSEFARAFTHYEAILASDPPAELFTATMTRIAWITFVGNGEIDLSLQVIDRALEATPGSTEALYVKGQILWCGRDDAEAAAALFATVAESTQLEAEIRNQVEADLAAAVAGESC
ncbi:MAG: hypothetical protein R3246_05710 [Acidimicrobiia bacterium]|nr:hypothetical protein [Acidimicrobiia bacterium]